MAIAPISSLQPTQGLQSISPLKPSQKSGPSSFEKVVDNLSKEMTTLDKQAESEIAKLASGKADNVHQVMLALGKNELAFNYMLEVRNRIVEAYKEVSRMSL